MNYFLIDDFVINLDKVINITSADDRCTYFNYDNPAENYIVINRPFVEVLAILKQKGIIKYIKD